MPKFKYKGYTGNGMDVAGTVTAKDSEDAAAVLANEDILVTNIGGDYWIFRKSRIVTEDEFYKFNQEFLALLKAGVPLLDSLKASSNRPGNEGFSEILSACCQEVAAGMSYSSICSKYPEVFDSVYQGAMRSAEHSGDLVLTLTQYLQYLHRSKQVKREIKSALYYPVFLFTALIAVLVILFLFVIPNFSGLYESFDADLPLATQIVVSISNYFPYMFFLFLGLVFWGAAYIKSAKPEVKYKVDLYLNKLPVIGTIRKLQQQARTLRMLSGLLATGNPLVTSLSIVVESTPNSEIGNALSGVVSTIKNGGQFSKSLSGAGVFSPQVICMLQSGEAAGALPSMMTASAEFIEEEMDQHLTKLSALFEPIVMVLIGVMVGVVIVAMYLPIFYMADVVK